MKITFDGKEYSIKFGYKATVKSGIIKKIAKAESDKEKFMKKTYIGLTISLLTASLFAQEVNFSGDLSTNWGLYSPCTMAVDST